MRNDPTLVFDDAALSVNPLGGVARVWRMLIEDIAQRKDAPPIVIISRSGQLDYLAAAVYNFPVWDWTWAAHDRRQLDAVMRDILNPVFISSHYSFSLEAPNLGIVHDLIPEKAGFSSANAGWSQRAIAVQLLDWAFCVSSETKLDLEKYYPKVSERASVNPISTDLRMFRSKSEAEIWSTCLRKGVFREDFALTVGSFSDYKQTTRLVTLWLQMNLPTQLVVSVPSEARAHEHMPGTPPSKVRFVEATDAELSALYSGAKFTIQSSRLEGFGLPVLESRLCSTPVIALRSAETTESSEGTGVFFINRLSATELETAITVATSMSRVERGEMVSTKELATRTRKFASALISKSVRMVGTEPIAKKLFIDSHDDCLEERFLLAEAREHGFSH